MAKRVNCADSICASIPCIISSTGGGTLTPLKCSLIGLHGGWRAWRVNQSSKQHG